MKKDVEKLLEKIVCQIIRGEREGRAQIDKNSQIWWSPYDTGKKYEATGHPTGIISFSPTLREWDVIEGGRRNLFDVEYQIGKAVWACDSCRYPMIDRLEGDNNNEHGSITLYLKNGLELF